MNSEKQNIADLKELQPNLYTLWLVFILLSLSPSKLTEQHVEPTNYFCNFVPFKIQQPQKIRWQLIELGTWRVAKI